MPLEQRVAKILTRRKKTLSTAESCSGGLLAHRLTNISGSSNFFKLGLIAYSNNAKQRLLRVPAQLLKTFGAVSPEVALAMADNVKKVLNTDFGIAITGIAGPTGATKTKPVGLVYIAVSSKHRCLCKRFLFKGRRSTVKSLASTAALRLLLTLL